MFEIEPLINKTVAFRYKGKELEFDLSHALFSSFDVDAGTRLLLKEVAQDPVLDAASLVLDAGCGTGVIGISLAAALPRARFILQDRDTLACEFSFHNCKKNGISASLFSLDGTLRDSTLGRKAEYEAESRTGRETDMADTPEALAAPDAPDVSDAPQVLIYPGLLAGQNPCAEAYGGYDVVISNVPAKAGASVLTDFFESCQAKLLRPSGRLAFVIVNTLVDVADAWRAQSPMRLIRKTKGPSHTVFILEKPASGADPSDRPVQRDYPTSNSSPNFSRPLTSPLTHPLTFDLTPYFRSQTTFMLGKRSAVPIKATGFWGLPEFDTPSYATQLAVETLENLDVVRDVVRPDHSDNGADGETLQLENTSKPEKRPGTEMSFFVYEPGIGLSALWVREFFHPAKMELTSRNVLSLLATRFNLELEGKDLAGGKNIHPPDKSQGRPEVDSVQHVREDIILRFALDLKENCANSHSLVLWFCDEIPEYNYIEKTLGALDSLLQPGGIAVVVGTSAAIAKLEKRRPSALRRLSSKKLKGFSSLALAKSI